jgi:Na+-driven multidrug efflux pump
MPPRGRASASLRAMLDRLRWVFPLVVALVLPLAGAVMAAIRFGQGDREEALRIAAATLLGAGLYALLFT